MYDVLYSHVRAVVAKGNAVEFGLNSCCIWDENGRLRGMGSLADKLYQLYCEVVSTGYASVAQSCSDLWHQRLKKKRVQNEFVRRMFGRKDVSKTVFYSGRDWVDA